MNNYYYNKLLLFFYIPLVIDNMQEYFYCSCLCQRFFILRFDWTSINICISKFRIILTKMVHGHRGLQSKEMLQTDVPMPCKKKILEILVLSLRIHMIDFTRLQSFKKKLHINWHLYFLLNFNVKMFLEDMVWCPHKISTT